MVADSGNESTKKKVRMPTDVSSRPRCLVLAANDPPLAQLLHRLVSEARIEPIPVQSQDELLARVRSEVIACVIINEQRPHDDALAIAQHVREQFTGVLLLLLETVHPHRALPVADGNTTYLIKPFDRDALHSCLHSRLHQG